MKDYAYSVARVRARELQLLSDADIDRMIMADDAASALAAIRDKGYASNEEKDVISATEKELWEFISEIADDELVEILRYPTDYHNVKVAIKSVYRNIDGTDMLLDNGNVEKDFLYDCIRNRHFSDLPGELSHIAEDALSLILRTGDGQLCDMSIDKAMLEQSLKKAEETSDGNIIRYARLQMDIANIKTALRCIMMKKSDTFTKNALATGGTFDTDRLAEVTLRGIEELCGYINGTELSDGAEYIKKSSVAFEKWCDDKIMHMLEDAKFESFSSAPVIAYMYAKMTEIKIVRLILSGKRNNFSEDSIRERVRKVYV